MKRAMTVHAKAERAQKILSAAVELYKEAAFEEIKMIDIAKKVGVSKGTLFNYYKSKESLFMEILFSEYDKRFNALTKRVQTYETMDQGSFKECLFSEMETFLDENSIYLRLNAIKNTILEKNVDYDMILKDKMELYENGMQLARTISEKYPALSPEAVFDLFMAQNSIIMGVLSISRAPQALKEGIREHNLSGFEIDFKKRTLEMMEIYMDGFFSKVHGDA
jgi:AcrR family transcriptional regulator